MGLLSMTAPGDEPPAEKPTKKHDQAFFLDRAAKGKDAWNAWRCDPVNKDVCVTFAGIDFSDAQTDWINFSGFQFGDNADFSGCKWRGEMPRKPEVFDPGRALFAGAAFGYEASFAGAAFGDSANFGDTFFKGPVIFTGQPIDQLSFEARALGRASRPAWR